MRLATRLLTISLALSQRLIFGFKRHKKSNPSRVLLAHYLLLGDTFLLAPLMKRVNEVFPESEKYVLVRPGFAGLFAGNPYGFKAITFSPKGFFDVLKIRKQGPFDQTYVLGDNRYAWLASAVGSQWIIGFYGDRPNWKNWMLDEQIPFDNKPAAWADMAARLVDGNPPGAFQPDEWQVPGMSKAPEIPQHSKGYVVFHLGASGSLKLWAADSWKRIISWANQNGYSIVLSVGPGEQRLLHEIDDQNKYIQIAGSYSLVEMWHLIKKAALLVSPDTGIAHMGKLTSTPTIALFGPGSPLIHGAGEFWKNAPYYPAWSPNFECRNQSILFRRPVGWVRRCGRGVKECATPGACMNAISPESVISLIRRVLS